METILSILQKTTDFFKKYGVESSRLDAEHLIAHLLDCKRMQLYLEFERPMPEELLQQLRPLLKRRAAREPLQYIVGSTGFMDFQLFTDSRALIPRPETEELIEIIQQDFSKSAPLTILDLGTGTGAIACALARLYPDARVVAVDVSEDALALCQKNVSALGLETQIRCFQSDWFEQVEGSFDLIVSNPPYLSDAELGEVEPELRKYEPDSALSSGSTGMECIEILLAESPKYMNPDGSLYLETGQGQEAAIIAHAGKLGLPGNVECLKDLNQKHRFVRYRKV